MSKRSKDGAAWLLMAWALINSASFPLRMLPFAYFDPIQDAASKGFRLESATCGRICRMKLHLPNISNIGFNNSPLQWALLQALHNRPLHRIFETMTENFHWAVAPYILDRLASWSAFACLRRPTIVNLTFIHLLNSAVIKNGLSLDRLVELRFIWASPKKTSRNFEI